MLCSSLLARRHLAGSMPLARRCMASMPSQSPSSAQVDQEAVVDEKLGGSMGFLVCILRAIESARENAICNDPFADALSRHARPAIMPMFEEWKKGEEDPSLSIGLRTRYHDDAINGRNPAIRQVVMLGAGLDSRAYYLESLRGCHVLEVDESAEIFAHKKQVFEKMGVTPITQKDDYIVANLMDPEWETKLLEKGFDSNVPTFWSMEGLLPYLDRAGNERLLSTIDALSAPGSECFADITGEVMAKPTEVELLDTVEDMKKEESKGGILQYGEDDPRNGILSQIGWDLTIQADLGKPGMHFGRKWKPMVSDASKETIPYNYLVVKKPVA